MQPLRRRHLLVLLPAFALAAATGTQAASLGWTRIQHPALEGGGSIAYVNDVLAPEDGGPWLMGGFTVNADGIRTPTVWTTKDGHRWSRSTLPPSRATERRDGVYLLARRGTTHVALGERFDSIVRNAAWVAENGRWTALDDSGDPLVSYSGRLVAVTRTATGFLAVGAQQSALTSSVRIFTSVDGHRWQIHSDLPLGEARFFPLGVANSPERIVIVGSTLGRSGDGDIWTWVDGAWLHVNDDASALSGPGGDQVAAVAFRQGVGFVAGGLMTRNGLEQPTAWVSADGLSWHALPAGTLRFPSSGGAVHEIVVTDFGFVAAGNSPGGALVWRSTNGRQWVALSPPKTANVGGERIKVAATNRATVVTVQRENGSDVFVRGAGGSWSVVDKPPAFPNPKVAAAELRGVAVWGDQIVAIGNDGRDRPLVMASRNARSWTRIPFDDPAARFLSVAANRGTFVIAGWRLLRGRAHFALWTSRDIRGWQRFGGETFDPSGAFVDVAADGEGFSALAFEASPRGFRTSVWSGDRRSWRSGRILGYGEARAICVGPHGATAISMRDGNAGTQAIAWQRGRNGRWSHDAEVIATRAEISRCEDVGFGTIAVGSDERFQSARWTRRTPGDSWEPSVLNVSSPRPMLYDVTRDGRSVLISGAGGARGQLDLVLWRLGARSLYAIGGGDPQFSAPGAQSALCVVAYEGRIVMVGRSGVSDAAIWVGKEPPPPSGPPPNGL